MTSWMSAYRRLERRMREIYGDGRDREEAYQAALRGLGL